MQVSFLINNIKPCSINKAYYKTRKVMTLDGRRYRKRLLSTMAKNPEIKQQIDALTTEFDPGKHGIKLSLYFFIPEPKMYTKQGHISMASGDVDNYVKLTTDFLFNSKYIGHVFPGLEHVEISNFGIDDRFIVDTRAYKMPSDTSQWSVGVKASLVSRGFKRPGFALTANYSSDA